MNEMFSFVAVPLAESQCQAEWGGRHGPLTEDHRGCNRRESQEAIHGRLYLCILN